MKSFWTGSSLAAVSCTVIVSLLSSATYSLAESAPAGPGALLLPCPVATKKVQLKGNCAGPLLVAADDVTVNLRGFSVICPNEESGEIGILLEGRSGVTVRTGSVKCGYAVQLTDSNNNRFNDLELGTDFIENARAINLVNSDGNTFSSIVANGGFDGLATVLTDSNDNRFTNSHFVCSDFSAIVATGNGNEFSKNIVETSLASAAIYIIGDDTVLDKNTVTGSVDSGIFLTGNDAMIKRNVISGATTGITVSGTGHVIERNVTSNMQYGMIVSGDTHTVKTNIATQNAETDLVYVGESCDDNTWKKNSFSTDSEGDGPARGCIR